MRGAPADSQFRIPGEEARCLGLSSGINVAGAIALGQQLRAEGRATPRVPTILCDTGLRYLSTIYNRDWLEGKRLPVFGWL